MTLVTLSGGCAETSLENEAARAPLTRAAFDDREIKSYLALITKLYACLLHLERFGIKHSI